MRLHQAKACLRNIYDGAFIAASKLPLCDVTISIKSKKCGFFGDLAMTLNGIRLAETARTNCRVCWDERSLYFDPIVGPNVWEYCFEQSLFYFADSTGPLRFNIPYETSACAFIPYPGISQRDSLSSAISNYCQPLPLIHKRVQNYVAKNFAHSTLGVHYRGTDATAGFEGRSSMSLVRLEAEVSKWLSINRNGNVFLATDVCEAVELLSNRFPGAIHYQNCLRSTNGLSLHGHYDDGNSASGYQKCVDVLTDALLLSECSTLFARESRVVWFAAAKNLSLRIVNIP